MRRDWRSSRFKRWRGATLTVLVIAFVTAARPAAAQQPPSPGFQDRFSGEGPMPVFARPENRFGAALMHGRSAGEPSLLDPTPLGSPEDPSSTLLPVDRRAATGTGEPDAQTAHAPPPAGRIEEQAADRPRQKPERSLGRGLAAWYEHPGRTASGELYKPDGLTAAHRTLPFGARVRVVNPRNGRSVVVRINDRNAGPRKIAIDLSRGAARRLGIEGIGPVAMQVVSSPEERRTPVAQMAR